MVLVLLLGTGFWWLGGLQPGSPGAVSSPAGWDPAAGPLSLVQAIELSQQRYAGEVIDAELKSVRGEDDGGGMYEIRLLTGPGNVLRIRIDASDGSFLEVDGHGLVEARRP